MAKKNTAPKNSKRPKGSKSGRSKKEGSKTENPPVAGESPHPELSHLLLNRCPLGLRATVAFGGVLTEIQVRPNHGLFYIGGVKSLNEPNEVDIIRVTTGGADIARNAFTFDAATYVTSERFHEVDWGVISQMQPLIINAQPVGLDPVLDRFINRRRDLKIGDKVRISPHRPGMMPIMGDVCSDGDDPDNGKKSYRVATTIDNMACVLDVDLDRLILMPESAEDGTPTERKAPVLNWTLFGTQQMAWDPVVEEAIRAASRNQGRSPPAPRK